MAFSIIIMWKNGFTKATFKNHHLIVQQCSGIKFQQQVVAISGFIDKVLYFNIFQVFKVKISAYES